MAEPRANDETAIRKIIEARTKAVHAGDIGAMMTDVADDVMIFDVVDPLRRAGKASSRQRAAEWYQPTTARSIGRTGMCK